jgi:hypothetical protein
VGAVGPDPRRGYAAVLGLLAVLFLARNHNALYHTIQAGALLLLFQGARWLVAQEAAPPRPAC